MYLLCTFCGRVFQGTACCVAWVVVLLGSSFDSCPECSWWKTEVEQACVHYSNPTFLCMSEEIFFIAFHAVLFIITIIDAMCLFYICIHKLKAPSVSLLYQHSKLWKFIYKYAIAYMCSAPQRRNLKIMFNRLN